MSNRYSVDYANKTVRQLPYMEKPDRSNYYISTDLHDESECYANDLKQYEYYALNMPTYRCPTMPDSWRERDTVELGKDFTIGYQMKGQYNLKEDWINISKEVFDTAPIKSNLREIAIPIAEVKCDNIHPGIKIQDFINADPCIIQTETKAEIENEKPDEDISKIFSNITPLISRPLFDKIGEFYESLDRIADSNFRDKLKMDFLVIWRGASYTNDGLEAGEEYIIEKEMEIKRLNEVIAFEQSERKQWADMCIKKQQKIEELEKIIARW